MALELNFNRALQMNESFVEGRGDTPADRPFIAGDHFSVGDITPFCGVNFGRVLGISVRPDQANLLRWFEAVARRPSARA